jgi:hypothetical protein
LHKKSSHPDKIEFNAGKAITAFSSIERPLYRLGANIVCIAAKQCRDLAVRHPNLRHAEASLSTDRGKLTLNW